MIPLYSSHYKQIITAHKYKSYDWHKYDVVLFLLPSNLLYLFVVNKQAEVLIKRRPIPYLIKLEQEMRTRFPKVNWDVHRIEAFYIENEDSVELYTFIFLTDSSDNIYTFKTECSNILDDKEPFRFDFVDCLSEQQYLIAGLLLKENLIFNDYQTIDTVNGYVMYIEYSDKKIDGKPVLGKQLLISNEDKEQFKKKHPDITLPNQNVVVNCIDKPIYLYKLPDQSEKVQFQFTNGLLYVRFTEPDFELKERFKI